MNGFCLIRGFWRESREMLAEQATGFAADVWLATNKTLFETQQNAVTALIAEIRTPMADSATLRDLDNLRLFFMDAANFAGEMYARQVRP